MEETGTQAATTNEGEQTEVGSQDTSLLGGDTEVAEQQETAETSETSETTEEEETPEGAPEKYELKAPEGQEFDGVFLEAYEGVARELNLSNEKAQMLIDKLSPVMQKQQQERIEAVRAEWTESSKVDKEFGGAKLQENLAVAKTALDKFGTPELKKLINDSGIGNHPELIRFFYRTGKAIEPDTFVGGHKDGATSGPRNFNDFADALYSN